MTSISVTMTIKLHRNLSIAHDSLHHLEIKIKQVA